MQATVTHGRVAIAGARLREWPPRRHVFDNDSFTLYGETVGGHPWALIVGPRAAEFCAVLETEGDQGLERRVRGTRQQAEAMLVDIAKGLQPPGSVRLAATVVAGCDAEGPHQNVVFTQGAATVAVIRHPYGVAGRWAMLLAAAEQDGEARLEGGGTTLSIDVDGTFAFTARRGLRTVRAAAGRVGALVPALRAAAAEVEGPPAPGPFLGMDERVLAYRGRKMHYFMEADQAPALALLAQGRPAAVPFMSEGVPHAIGCEAACVVVTNERTGEAVWRIPVERAAPALAVGARRLAGTLAAAPEVSEPGPDPSDDKELLSDAESDAGEAFFRGIDPFTITLDKHDCEECGGGGLTKSD